MPVLPETAYFELAPDWLCEILSPSSSRMDRVDKLPIYAREGVGYIWLVDPDVRTLEVMALHEGHWLWLNAYKDDDEVCAAPLDAITFSLAALWP
jgi:Uma2 family endonuclease